jgi:mRNA-degrading endonuclease RelE of RelBE toxin-antitoxin system
MKHRVSIKRKTLKEISKMPKGEQTKLALLVDDLIESGPVQQAWPNFSKLSETRYHCHLSGKWVACWSHEKGTIEIEVYYAGSRENAPY